MRINYNIRFKLRTGARLMAAAAAMLLSASCNKDKHEIPVERPILMSALQSNTRALVHSIDELGSHSAETGFGVFGYKTIGSGDDAVDTYVFNNQNVTAEGSNGDYTWSYTPLKYWDMDAFYHFVAYWPHTTASGVVTNDETNHKLTLNVSNWQSVNGSEKDWMIANDYGSAATYYFGREQNNGIVYFDFEHLLAQIEIKAWYYGNENKAPTITSLDFGSSLNQVPSSVGTVDVSKVYSTPVNDEPNSVVWSTFTTGNLDNSVQLAANSTVTAFSTDEEGVNFVPPTDGVQDINTVCQWLVVPFATANCPMTVKYRIGDSNTDLQAVINNTTFGTLESGKIYTLTLKFNTKTNTLDPISVLVRNWNDITVTDDERYNW